MESPGGISDAFQKPLGRLWRAFCGLCKASWKLQGAFWGPVGVPGGLGGLLENLLGASRKPVGDLVGVSWGRLRGSWNLLGSLWGASLSLQGGL